MGRGEITPQNPPWFPFVCDRYIINVESCRTSMRGSPTGDLLIAKLNELGIAGAGRITPLWPVTLPSMDRVKANIPQNAEMYCWGYALEDLHRLGTAHLETFDKDDPNFQFLYHGGFIYLDDRGDVCAVNAVTQQQGQATARDQSTAIHLKGPTHWSAELTDALHYLYPEMRSGVTGRWQPCLDEELCAAGVRFYTFLAPNEQVGDADPQWRHGAFVYLQHDPADPPAERGATITIGDSYFRVISSVYSGTDHV